MTGGHFDLDVVGEEQDESSKALIDGHFGSSTGPSPASGFSNSRNLPTPIYVNTTEDDNYLRPE